VDKVGDLGFVFAQHLRGGAVTHLLKIDQVKCFPVVRLEPGQRCVELAALFALADGCFGQGAALGLKRQLLQREKQPPPLLVPQGQPPPGLIG